MKLKGWYVALLIGWAVLILPGLVLSFGFAGGWPQPPMGPYSSSIDVGIWVLGISLALSPALLLPFGVRRRK